MEEIKELIKIDTNDKGMNCVSARELYEKLGFTDSDNFSRWIKKQLQNVDAIENGDYVKTFFKEGLSKTGQTKTDYIITIDIAKEICMIVGVTPKVNEETKRLSKQFRQYFIQCEKELVNNKPMLTPQQQCILDIYEGGIKAVESAKQLVELEVEPHRHGEDERWTATKLVEELRSSVKILDDFKLTTTDLHKWFIFNGYGNWKVIDTKGAVSKKGYFKPNDKFMNEVANKGYAVTGLTSTKNELPQITYKPKFLDKILNDSIDSLVNYVKSIKAPKNN